MSHSQKAIDERFPDSVFQPTPKKIQNLGSNGWA